LFNIKSLYEGAEKSFSFSAPEVKTALVGFGAKPQESKLSGRYVAPLNNPPDYLKVENQRYFAFRK